MLPALASLVPMRWPCGPLEIARLRRENRLTKEAHDTLQRWAHPRTLTLLAHTPVNCLLVPWTDDDEHQRSLRPLIDAGRASGLTFLGWIDKDVNPEVAAKAGKDAGLAGVAGEELSLSSSPLASFSFHASPQPATGSFLGLTSTVWPGVKLSRKEEAADAGATGAPWIDSNGWFLQMARSIKRAGTTWLLTEPPADSVVTAGAYSVAVADAASCGARWVVSLDAGFRHALSEGDPAAVRDWRQIVQNIAFFEERRGWRSWIPQGNIGVVADFSGSNEFLSGEVLNLMARQGALFRVIDKAALATERLDELKGLLWADPEPPPDSARSKLMSFAQIGGTVIVGPGWNADGRRKLSSPIAGFDLVQVGKGRLAVARAAFDEPYLLAKDTRFLVSHAHDIVRVFNPGTALWRYALRPDGRAAVLHILRFAANHFENEVTVWFKRQWPAGRLSNPEERAPLPLRPRRVRSGVEFHFSPVSTYAAVELTDVQKGSA